MYAYGTNWTAFADSGTVFFKLLMLKSFIFSVRIFPCYFSVVSVQWTKFDYTPGFYITHFISYLSYGNVPLKPISQLRFDYYTTTTRRYHDAFDYDGSDRNYDLRSIRLQYDYDEKLTCSFFVRIE